ncbi:hypothetical protein [Succinimonas amylolytica]|uniref:hypothetical protein n=1 Tax=Succinimonas amylolytica TaxID=83769 RepID=UPI0023A8AE4C
MLADEINRVLAEVSDRITPLDRNTGESETCLNGFKVTFHADEEQNLLTISAPIFQVDNLYDENFQKLSHKILSMNSPEILPAGLRLGVDVVALTVTLYGQADVSGTPEAAAMSYYVKTVLYYLGQVKEELLRFTEEQAEED